MFIAQNKKSVFVRACEQGFTLLEVLIALFIFTILSMILVGALHSVITASTRTEQQAERLRALQMALLIMSRDIEQTVNRPVLNASGREDQSFIGTARDFTFTHAGLANPTGNLARSNLQRTHYYSDEHSLWRANFGALDQAPNAAPQTRRLLQDVTDVHFQYVDKTGRLHPAWPLQDQNDQVLPQAVKVFLTIPEWGQMSQVYVISITPKQPTPPAQPKS